MSERPQPLKAINRFFDGKEPWQIVTMTASSVLAIVWAHSLYNAKDSVTTRLRREFFRWLRQVPIVRRKIEEKMTEINSDFRKDVKKKLAGVTIRRELPETGLDAELVLEEIRANNFTRIRMVRASCLLASCALFALLLTVPSSAYPRYPSNYYRDDAQYEPEEIMDMLNRLGNLIQMERKMDNYRDDITSEKRALDLGLSRGYSGALQAKHLMGLAAANYAGGPGRRRRDAH